MAIICDKNLLEVTAGFPLDSLEDSVLIVAQAVQARSKRHATTRRCTVRMLVVCVERSMEVLHLVSKSTRYRNDMKRTKSSCICTREMLYCVRSCPMRAVLVSLSPGISFPLRIGGRPATLKVIVLNLPDVWASAEHRKGSWSKREPRILKKVEADVLQCLSPGSSSM